MPFKDRQKLPQVRLAFNRATDRRSEPREPVFEIYLRDTRSLSPRQDIEATIDQKTSGH
jgi:hypothetical protein